MGVRVVIASVFTVVALTFITGSFYVIAGAAAAIGVAMLVIDIPQAVAYHRRRRVRP